MVRGRGLLAEAAAAAAAELVFAPVPAALARLGVLRCAGLSAPAGRTAPGDSGGAGPHQTREPGSTDSTPCIAVSKYKRDGEA